MGPSKCIFATLTHKDSSTPYMVKYFSLQERHRQGFSPSNLENCNFEDNRWVEGAGLVRLLKQRRVGPGGGGGGSVIGVGGGRGGT